MLVISDLVDMDKPVTSVIWIARTNKVDDTVVVLWQQKTFSKKWLKFHFYFDNFYAILFGKYFNVTLHRQTRTTNNTHNIKFNYYDYHKSL